MRLPLTLLATLLVLPMLPASAQSQTESIEAQLCRNQLDLLLSREKLTQDEEAVFNAQCDCLEEQAKSSDPERQACAQAHD
ncbi:MULTISPECIES: hypothetical protein [unclassified Devosia]|uniref:hypothetical protein n=1 Tax=unclassified Devosia TaxID=196773 RepID=UPI00145CC8D7|nr:MULTISPECIES: hypothetical protein [unclassified Devosia]MBJ6986748.1 hypothetical protein [Devosia sp. MC521]QMW61780.1 hypothetical protein H4N61_12515 [Devosia sp. MC521]